MRLTLLFGHGGLGGVELTYIKNFSEWLEC